MGSVLHQLKTVLNHAMDAEAAANSRIALDCKTVNDLVRLFQSGAWNNELPEGCSVKPEGKIRFGTAFEVVPQFLKAASYVSEIVATKRHSGATAALVAIETSEDPCIIKSNTHLCRPLLTHLLGFVIRKTSVTSSN